MKFNRPLTHCLIACVALCIWAASLHAQADQPPATWVQEAYKQFNALQDETGSLPWRERVDELRSSYEKMFDDLWVSKAALSRLATDDLHLYFRATADMTFYSNDARYLARLRSILRVLEARNEATNIEYARLYDLYVATRQFAHAKGLLKRHPNMDVAALPPVIDDLDVAEGLPSVLSIHSDGVIKREVVHVDPGIQIIVVAHPSCHFTRNAVRDLVSHHAVWEQLTEHARWLAPQDGRIDLEAFQAWNEHVPAARIDIAYRQTDWPSIDTWATPAFYFFKHGELVDEVMGWPKEGRLDAILLAMRKIGLNVTTDTQQGSMTSQ